MTALIAFGFFVVLSTILALLVPGLWLGLANLGAVVVAILLARVVRS